MTFKMRGRGVDHQAYVSVAIASMAEATKVQIEVK